MIRVTIELREGEAHGFLGPTGAGKSVTLRKQPVLLRREGLLQPGTVVRSESTVGMGGVEAVGS